MFDNSGTVQLYEICIGYFVIYYILLPFFFQLCYRRILPAVCSFLWMATWSNVSHKIDCKLQSTIKTIIMFFGHQNVVKLKIWREMLYKIYRLKQRKTITNRHHQLWSGAENHSSMSLCQFGIRSICVSMLIEKKKSAD